MQYRTWNQLETTGGHVFRALTTKQETMATLTAPPTDYLSRFQRCLIVASMLLAMFTIQIWCVAVALTTQGAASSALPQSCGIMLAPGVRSSPNQPRGKALGTPHAVSGSLRL